VPSRYFFVNPVNASGITTALATSKNDKNTTRVALIDGMDGLISPRSRDQRLFASLED